MQLDRLTRLTSYSCRNKTVFCQIFSMLRSKHSFLITGFLSHGQEIYLFFYDSAVCAGYFIPWTNYQVLNLEKKKQKDWKWTPWFISNPNPNFSANFSGKHSNTPPPTISFLLPFSPKADGGWIWVYAWWGTQFNLAPSTLCLYWIYTASWCF